ncbi:MAG: 50S ribosomal protein L29 [Candidatus Doudnabacteria bacterium]|nr:50S ribosomal protein L29 [Candidatus Doudnabacteria bacterium]
MKSSEIRKKSKADLERQLLDLREQARDLRFKIGSREIKNHQLLRKTRKDIARILTILKEGEKQS